MSRKGFLRIGVLSGAVAATVIATSGIASASVSPTSVVADSACQALEFTKLIGGHDHMFVDPTVATGLCVWEIVDADNGDVKYVSTSPAGNQPAPDGVYDGPGENLWVLVTDQITGRTAHGPAN